MEFMMPQFSVALPELFMLGMVVVILAADVCLSARFRSVVYYLTQATLAVAFFLTLAQFREYPQPIITFSGNYIVDKLAVLSKLIIFFFSMLAFLYAHDYIRKQETSRSEYFLLGLFAVIGMSVMASAFTFLTIFLGLELLSLSLYAMVAMDKHSSHASEAAMKYFVLGSLATGILLYGISLLYGVTGSIQMDTIALALQSKQSVILYASLVFILVGLLFKFGAVPFHMWVPDVYQGAATPTTLFIASAPKVAAFAITIRILVHALPDLQANWEHILIIVAVLSMLFGNLLAIAQTNIKRMLAYSSIAHIGYTLLGMIAGPNSTQGYSAAMFYISTYVLVAAGAFAIITIMGNSGESFDKLEDYRGLNARNPWLAFMMLLLLFSMAGVPPTVGFIAKLGLLEALVQAHYVWLAVLALLFALIGAYYYLRVVKIMYFDEPAEKSANVQITLSKDMLIAISINGSAALLLGILPSFFINLCRLTVG